MGDFCSWCEYLEFVQCFDTIIRGRARNKPEQVGERKLSGNWLTEIYLESDQCWCGKDVDCFFSGFVYILALTCPFLRVNCEVFVCGNSFTIDTGSVIRLDGLKPLLWHFSLYAIITYSV